MIKVLYKFGIINNINNKVVIKITGLRDQTPSKIVNFHEQRAITSESMVRYRPL